MAANRTTSRWWTVWGLLILLWAAVSSRVDGVAVVQGSRHVPQFDADVPSAGLVVAELRLGFSDSLFTSALRNSFGISIIATTLSVVIAMFAAVHAIARLDFPLKKVLLSMALAIAMFPQAALVGPLFDMWRRLGIYDTWIGLIIPYLTFALPLSIWTMSAFFRQIPWEMEQAAQVDGATQWQAFRKVIVPMAAPGGRVHDGDPHLLLLLERVPARHVAHVDRQIAHRAGSAQLLYRAVAIPVADHGDHGGIGRRDDPGRDHRVAVPTADRRRAHIRCRQGLIEGKGGRGRDQHSTTSARSTATVTRPSTT